MRSCAWSKWFYSTKSTFVSHVFITFRDRISDQHLNACLLLKYELTKLRLSKSFLWSISKQVFEFCKNDKVDESGAYRRIIKQFFFLSVDLLIIIGNYFLCKYNTENYINHFQYDQKTTHYYIKNATIRLNDTVTLGC